MKDLYSTEFILEFDKESHNDRFIKKIKESIDTDSTNIYDVEIDKLGEYTLSIERKEKTFLHIEMFKQLIDIWRKKYDISYATCSIYKVSAKKFHKYNYGDNFCYLNVLRGSKSEWKLAQDATEYEARHILYTAMEKQISGKK